MFTQNFVKMRFGDDDDDDDNFVVALKLPHRIFTLHIKAIKIMFHFMLENCSW